MLFSDKSAENPTEDLSDASEDDDGEPIMETDSLLGTSHDDTWIIRTIVTKKILWMEIFSLTVALSHLVKTLRL